MPRYTRMYKELRFQQLPAQGLTSEISVNQAYKIQGRANQNQVNQDLKEKFPAIKERHEQDDAYQVLKAARKLHRLKAGSWNEQCFEDGLQLLFFQAKS